MQFLWAFGLAVTAARADSTWVRVETPNFTIYNHVGEEQGAAIAMQLERFRVAVAASYPGLTEGKQPPLPIIAFTGSDEFSQFVAPARDVGETTAPPAGVFRTSGLRPLVAVDLGRWAEGSGELYASYLSSLIEARTRAPLWLRTGLALYWSTAAVDAQRATLGKPPPGVVERLKDERWLRLEEILTAQAVRPRRQDLFAAQSWLLVHWFLADPERAATVRDLLDPLLRLDPTAPTNPQSLPRGWLTEQLRDHLDVAAAGVVQDHPGVDANLAGLVPVTEVEAEYRLGQLLTLQRQPERARIMFDHALQLDPNSWMPYDGRGLLASANLQFGEARRAWSEAVARTPTTAGPYFDHGRTLLSRPHGAKARADAAQSMEMVTLLDPTYLPAYASLADLAYRDGDVAESVRWAGRGLQVDPRDSRLRALLGRAQFAAGDVTHARINTQLALQECRDAAACSDVASVLKIVLERMPDPE